MITTSSVVHNPSVNIIRDLDAHFDYTTTDNAQIIFEQIVDSRQSGRQSFILLGSYGTGKSSFLWALNRTLGSSKEAIFDYSQTGTTYKFINIIGEYGSFSGNFAECLDLASDASSQAIIKGLNRYYNTLEDKQGLFIVVDEFGKFLEHAAKANPEKEMYFIQQLAEWVNNKDRDCFLIFTLHQSFDAYGLELSKKQRKEWDKVKGRFSELSFNEPVEQLLNLAAKRIERTYYKQIKEKEVDSAFLHLVKKSGVFPLRNDLSEDIAKKLRPLDVVSAACLILALQKYGQNERSVFSFIESNERHGLREFLGHIDNSPCYSLALVYDYLNTQFFHYIHSKYNPHYMQWAAMRAALQRVSYLYEDDAQVIAQAIIKVTGLLGLFAPKHAKINEDFILKYLESSLGFNKKLSKPILDELEYKYRVLAYRKLYQKFVLIEGSAIDIELALIEAEKHLQSFDNLASKLKDLLDLPHILAKKITFDRGTPRFFAFELSETPLQLVPAEDIDGCINLVFSSELKAQDVQAFSANSAEAVLFGFFENRQELKIALQQVEKLNYVIAEYKDDRAAVQELNILLKNQIDFIQDLVLGGIDNGSISWFFQGLLCSIRSKKAFAQELSRICDIVYHKAPRFDFEMINKTRLSSAMLTARKKLFQALVNHSDQELLGMDRDKYPPERSIYEALIKEKKLHRNQDGTWGLTHLDLNQATGLNEIWFACYSFIEQSRQERKSLHELTALLLKRPYKIKKGLLDFWLPIFLWIVRDEFALFEDGTYIPSMSFDILELISKNPERYQVKAFDVEGIRLEVFQRYRTFLQQQEEENVGNQSFIETIKPFLTFYRKLSHYAKQTESLSKNATALRQAISEAKDPEKSFFSDFPLALGYSVEDLKNAHSLKGYFSDLQDAIREIRQATDLLFNQFEYQLLSLLDLSPGADFSVYKTQIQQRFKDVKERLLQPKARVFLGRINSILDQREPWLSSVANACIGKKLDEINDQEQVLLLDRLESMLKELDRAIDLSKLDINSEQEAFFTLSIGTLGEEGIEERKESVRLPKAKIEENEALLNKLRKSLSRDKTLNQALLIQLLQEQIQEHGKS